MATRTITAIFDSEACARDAAEHLGGLGVSFDEIQLEPARLRARIDDALAQLVEDALRQAGARSVETSLNVPTGEDWLAHQHDKITSTGVPPGQGDSEAGDPS